MAGESGVDESQLKGLSKYFNSQTINGRANTAKATMGVTALIIAYFMLKPKKEGKQGEAGIKKPAVSGAKPS